MEDDESDCEWPDDEVENNDDAWEENKNQIHVDDFIFMTLEDVELQFPSKLSEIIDTLAITNDEAISAMRHFHWNAEKLKEKWFD